MKFSPHTEDILVWAALILLALLFLFIIYLKNSAL
jgi:hypothetical protein